MSARQHTVSEMISDAVDKHAAVVVSGVCSLMAGQRRGAIGEWGPYALVVATRHSELSGGEWPRANWASQLQGRLARAGERLLLSRCEAARTEARSEQGEQHPAPLGHSAEHWRSCSLPTRG